MPFLSAPSWLLGLVFFCAFMAALTLILVLTPLTIRLPLLLQTTFNLLLTLGFCLFTYFLALHFSPSFFEPPLPWLSAAWLCLAAPFLGTPC